MYTRIISTRKFTSFFVLDNLPRSSLVVLYDMVMVNPDALFLTNRLVSYNKYYSYIIYKHKPGLNYLLECKFFTAVSTTLEAVS